MRDVLLLLVGAIIGWLARDKNVPMWVAWVVVFVATALLLLLWAR